MRKGETLLLHTASGGVGLAAIQLCENLGVNVIATAGSARKRNYLHNLGIKHVFNSRTTEFGKQVLEVTGGKGVDVVLNSLTSEGFKEASLECLAQNGRFIEMSKLNVWTHEDVKALRPDVMYAIADLAGESFDSKANILAETGRLLAAGTIKPLPFPIFDALNLINALEYLQKARHIGKVICLMPEQRVERSRLVVRTPFYNEQSTYIITGGLGGIGFEVAKYMLENGARHIALVGRSCPKADKVRQIEAWNKAGNHVQAFSVDIGDLSKCEALFASLAEPAAKFPIVRGVMHAAGVLRDNIFQNQSWDSFQAVFNPKVRGTWNLHLLTKGMPLEHFVLFSSTAATLGNPGQTNHSSANSFLDAFASYRNSIGLPATTINWGNWGEVGVATELDLPGVRPISTLQGITALDTMLRTQTSHLTVLNVESFAFLPKLIPILRYFLEDKRLLGEVTQAVVVSSDEFWQKVDGSTSAAEKKEALKELVKRTVRDILKLDEAEVVEDRADFQVLGVDSLMMLELKNALQKVLGSRLNLTAALFKDATNAEGLASTLVKVLEGESAEMTFPKLSELRELVSEDAVLPEHISPAKNAVPATDASKAKVVLLTGATGTLGPYLLVELCQRKSVEKIYCLARSTRKQEAADRLSAKLEKLGLQDKVDMGKVTVVEGDISEEKLGLTTELYDKLGEEVEAIIHSAVRVDWTGRYWRAPAERKSDMRTVNVKGTVRVLEFAVHKRLKTLYSGSTLMTVMTINEHGGMTEDWQDLLVFENYSHNLGYAISKHIGEQLVRSAVERGVPCKVFRYGPMTGESATGKCNYHDSHFLLRWLTFIQLQCMPDHPFPMHMIPVDHAAKISLEVFFHPDAPSDVYNVTHEGGGLDSDIIDVAAELGLSIKPVSMEEFLTKLKEEDTPLAVFQTFYEELSEQLMPGSGAMKFALQYFENSSEYFRARKMPRYSSSAKNMLPLKALMKQSVLYMRKTESF